MNAVVYCEGAEFLSEYYDENEIEPIEGYCLHCRETVEIEEPQPVWTRKGMPATRGLCPICGGTVFRMGKTESHDEGNRPAPIHIGDGDKRKLPKLQRDTAYVVYSERDEAIARQIASDLDHAGVTTWLHADTAEGESVSWAGGVHPALKECSRMVYVLSPASLTDDTVVEAWEFFRKQRKPIVIAQIAKAAPPDPIRRSPRFDFTEEYKRAFRQMIQALA